MKHGPLDTFGQRVRFARLSCGLTQTQFANAISAISKTRTSKSLVSHWETDRVTSPQSPTLLAMMGVTGFRHEWLANGTGPQKVEQGGADAFTRRAFELIKRAVKIAAENKSSPEEISRAAIKLIRTMQTDPKASPDKLISVAKSAN